MTQRDEWIRKCAYALWEEAGRPTGRDAEHLEQATAEWEAGARKTQDSMAGARPVNDFGPNTAKIAPN